MGSRICRVGADYISGVCSAVAPPCTLHIMVKAFGNVSSIIFAAGTSGLATNQYNIGLGSTNRAQANEVDTTSVGAATAANMTSNVWHAVTAVFASHSSRSIFIDGAQKVTNATVKTAGATNFVGIMGDTITGGAFPMNVCHAAIYSGALSDAEVLQLAGTIPSVVRPDILQEYWPMNANQSPEPSTQSANSLTVTGALYSLDDPFANYSRMPHPASAQMFQL
jgi:hypothetical protein